jgi:hypothetical protein
LAGRNIINEIAMTNMGMTNMGMTNMGIIGLSDIFEDLLIYLALQKITQHEKINPRHPHGPCHS